VEIPVVEETKKEAGETVAKEDFDKLTRRLDVLLGKYNSEAPRLNDRAKALATQNDELKDELDEAKAAKARELDPDAYKKYLSDEEKADMDPELLDFQSRLAQGIAENASETRTAELEGKVDSLTDLIANLQKSDEAASDTRFWSAAEATSPGVTKANTDGDEDWVAFLETTDPVSKLPYRTIGQAAIERGDHEVVSTLFNLHKGTTEAARATHVIPVEAQLKPETTQSTPRTDPRPNGPVIKESEIKSFYNRAAGTMTEAEISAKEVEFDRAALDGRIAFGK
jgi:hypothetical protein